MKKNHFTLIFEDQVGAQAFPLDSWRKNIMLYEYQLSTSREDLCDITQHVREAITNSNATSGIAVVFCLHTTAGITINENADPDVIHDLLLGLKNAYPNQDDFIHAESNSAAHLKATAIGSSATIIIKNGKPLLGTWQGVYFCEFDAPRNRKFYVTVINS